MNIDNTLDEIEKISSPLSVFTYGTQARSDTAFTSDYDIGVLVDDHLSEGCRTLRSKVWDEGISVNIFSRERFLSGDLDIPFTQNIFRREIITTGRTLRGEKIIENLAPPSIKTSDALADAQFNRGYALAAVIAYRAKSYPIASMFFSKSCLFSARALIMERTGKMPSTYSDIKNEAGLIELGEYADIVDLAYQARQSGRCSYNALVKNISFINRLVVPILRKRIEDEGDQIIIV